MFENLDLNDLSTGGLSGLVMLAFCVLGFVKGLVKMVFSLLALGLAVVAAYWGYQNGHDIAGNIVERPEPWMAVAVSVVAGIGVFSIAKSVLGFLTSGFNQTGTAQKIGFGPPAGIMGLLMGLFLVYAALSAVRYVGTVAELHRLDSLVTQKTPDAPARPFFIGLKEKIDASKPGRFHRKYDVLNDATRSTAAKLLVVRQDRVEFARLLLRDRTGALPALALPDNALLKLVEEKNFPTLLRDPALKKLAADPTVQAALEELDVEKSMGLE